MWRTLVSIAFAVVVGVNLHQFQQKSGFGVISVSDAEAATMYGTGCFTASTHFGNCSDGNRCPAIVSDFLPCPSCAKKVTWPCGGYGCGSTEKVQGACGTAG